MPGEERQDTGIDRSPISIVVVASQSFIQRIIVNKVNARILAAEFLGTFWLTFGGGGSAVLAAAFPQIGIGLLGVSLAFGLSVVTGAYAFGYISGAHFNPVGSFGLALAGRLKTSVLPGYVGAQVLGACTAAGVLFLIATGKPGADIGSFAANGVGEKSLGHYYWMAAMICEVVMTAAFLIVILGAAKNNAAEGFAGFAIGLCLTLIHLVSIPVAKTSVNPARSTGAAIFSLDWATTQLWIFWLAPLAGAALGALIHRKFLQKN